ncbi:PREDICTED: E3 ubiquitin-protein ligase RNF115-like isoform X2 [Nicrophorus vespilloides]|uniref:RING-type E3 ubiquitin transferase n=1 Tax=Nicrophorus vespilloides TaxID=110193 RepID=A0ABM1MT87_NICVS|nr:PREDICTED: E3 ubiquitin-protein ligase RNF115-like isoform X2 [Nicrophorus vespilloides]
MAEAAVEENVRFYCHMCNIRFVSTSQNFKCPQCSDGFVEKLESSAQNDEMDIDEGTHDGFYNVNVIRPITRLQTPHLMQPQTFENLIQEIIVNLGVGVNVMGGNGNMQFVFGNPGDYAWGREGLDAIVTQLLNQMDTPGPPPLAKDIIDAIPVVDVSKEQVDAKLQCSVCWEAFQLNEKVRQLACQHVYHEPCIRPWLELHSTCPICRQDLGTDEPPANGSSETANSGGITLQNTLQHLFQVVQNSRGGSSSTSEQHESQ